MHKPVVAGAQRSGHLHVIEHVGGVVYVTTQYDAQIVHTNETESPADLSASLQTRKDPELQHTPPSARTMRGNVYTPVSDRHIVIYTDSVSTRVRS